MNNLQPELDSIDRRALEAKREIVERMLRQTTDEAEFESLFMLRDQLYRDSCFIGMTDDERYAAEAERQWEAGALGEVDSPWYPA